MTTLLLLIELVAVATPFLIAHRMTRYDRRSHELAARADYQNYMLVHGHHGAGIYGNFQPAPELRTPLLVA